MNKRTFTASLVLVLSILACNLPAGGAATQTPIVITTTPGLPTETLIPTQTLIPTETPLPTFTLYPTSTPLPLPSPTIIFYTATFSIPTSGIPTVTGTLPTATVNSAALANGCNNLAFIRDVNLPAGTVVGKEEEITKTWKVQNIGTCEWKFQYRLAFLSGDDLRASGDYIRKQVAVWDWSEVSISFTSPSKPGTYTSYWRMVDGDGKMFGTTLVVSFVIQ